MINLENVSTERLITFLKCDIYKMGEVQDAYTLLNKYAIKDYQKLKDLILSGKRDFDNEFLKNALSSVEQNVKYANEIGREPLIYACNNYDGANVDEKTLKITDRKTLCGVLLYKSPAIFSKGKSGALTHIQISDAKDLLGKVAGHSKTSVGSNAFVESMTRFTNLDAIRLRDAINFYEEQVLRQAEETTRKKINLFELNQKEKYLIVRAEIKNIVKYLVENADVCVWGDFTPAQKVRLMNAVTTYRGYENQVLRDRIINVIANYTTLSELKSDVVKEKTLDRFIIK